MQTAMKTLFKKYTPIVGIGLGLLVINLMLSAQYEKKEAFAAAVTKLKASKTTERTVDGAEALAVVPISTAVPAATPVTFGDLREYKFSRKAKNPMPEKLKGLQGKDINIAGYMIPMTEALDVQEFMLVQIPFFGCCYSVPPEPNETVMVKMEKGKSTSYVYTPIRVTGKFKVQETTIDGFTVSVYQIDGAQVTNASPGDKDVMQHQAGTALPKGY
jgi:hypothetical protein